MERVGPYLEADLETLEDLDALRREVELGRRSARSSAFPGSATEKSDVRWCAAIATG